MRDYPAAREMLPARNKYEKEIFRQQGEILSLFFLCVLLCVAVRGGSCCLCNGAVASHGGKGIAPLHYIYNMTNNPKNKKRFFKGARASPGAPSKKYK